MQKREWIGAIAAAVLIGAAAISVQADEAAPAVKPSVKLAMGEKAPDIEAVGIDGKAVTLATFAGKPLVLQFGSLTEPVFRMRVDESEKLAVKFGQQVQFVVLYAHEAHAADGPDALAVNADAGFAQAAPVNEAQRTRLAGQAIDRLAIKNQQVFVDAWSNASSLRYGDYPNMTFVIDAKGNLQAGYAWMDPAKVTGALDALLAGKPVPAEFRGRTQAGSSGQMDYVEGAQEMLPGRGGGLGVVLDRLTLTDKQKAAIFPALADYLSQAKDFREKYGGGAAGARGGAGAARPAASAGGTAANAGDKAVSPEEFQKALEAMRATAQKLKTACQQNLSEKDAKAMLDALEQGPARRLFAD